MALYIQGAYDLDLPNPKSMGSIFDPLASPPIKFHDLPQRPYEDIIRKKKEGKTYRCTTVYMQPNS